MNITPGQHVLFLDDWAIEEAANIRRLIEPLAKHETKPILVPDQPWEGKQTFLYGNVLWDEQKKIFRMWYFTGTGLGDTDFLAVGYATSHDGLAWEKPLMNVIRHKGKPTNLVMRRLEWKGKSCFYEPFSIIMDKAEPDPRKRFKQYHIPIEFSSPVAINPKIKGSRRGMGLVTSPDGINWSPFNDWLTEDIIDISMVMFDPNRQQYILYGRNHIIFPEIKRKWGKYPWFKDNYWGRCVVRLVSTDGLHWSGPQMVMTADLQDPPGTDIYTMSVFPYHGLYIGMIQRYINNPDDTRRDGTLDYQYAVSHDGISFKKVGDRSPCLSIGAIGDWDRFNQSIAYAPVMTNDEIRFYYSGRTSRHTPACNRHKETGPKWGAIGMAGTKQDRFASLAAGFDKGTLITKPFIFNGSGFGINLLAPAGTVTVEILTPGKKPIRNLKAEAKGDLVKCRLNFNKNSLAALTGKSIRLRFTLTNARLYAFWLEGKAAVSALPNTILPIKTSPTIDSNFQVRLLNEKERTIFYIQNPGNWAVTGRIKLVGTKGRPVIALQDETKIAAGKDPAVFTVNLSPFGSAGFSTAASKARIESVALISNMKPVREMFNQRLKEIEKLLMKKADLSDNIKRPAAAQIAKIRRLLEEGKYALADSLWREPSFQRIRDYDLRLPRFIAKKVVNVYKIKTR